MRCSLASSLLRGKTDGISLIHTYLQVTTNLLTTHEQGHFQSLHVCMRENDKEQWSSKCDLLDELGHSQVSAQSSKFSVWMVSLTYAETAETVKRLVARAVVQTVPFEVSL